MRIFLSCLFTVVAVPLQAQQQQDQCLAPVSQFDANQLMPANQFKVTANRAEILENTIASFDGNVDIISDSAIIRAQKARINKSGQEVYAEGGVSYEDQYITVNSESVALDSVAEQLLMQQTDYALTGFTGQGTADTIALSKTEGLNLQGVSFTTCPVGDEDWKIKASEIAIDPEAAWGETRNTRFYIRDVPVFYLPYFAFPVSDKRQSGMLFPALSSSSTTGLDYEQPIYWNIAENYDATISPRFMSKRGLQLKTEFRYLTGDHEGQLNVEYLADDRETSNDDDRYFYRFYHRGQLTENWQINADINGISDDNYIVDLGSDYYNRADTHLYQTFGANYYSENLDFSIQFRDFEVIGDNLSSYRALPEMKLDYLFDSVGGAEFSINSELAYFDNQDLNSPTALRWHLEPSVTFPWQQQWGEFLAEAKLMNTYYRQDNVEGTQLAEEVNRTLGEVRFYGALNFERPTQWFGQPHTLTLEPKAQYLYTSFEDQNDIGLYDTTQLLNDYDGLFRGMEFTGLDRISDNNQVTLGITSRLLDENNREQFVVSLGQIFYLSDGKVVANSREDDRSALAGEMDIRLHNHWFAHADVQVSTSTDKIERSSVALEYRQDANRIIQASHRFVRDLSGEQIDQLGLTASWPLNKNWHWVGRWYKDLELQRTIESYTGIQYESCCWAIRMVGYRNLSNRYDPTGMQSSNEFDSGISLQFIFKGMGTASSNRNMLEDGLFGYRQPFVLN